MSNGTGCLCKPFNKQHSPSSSCFYKLLDILPDHACLKVYGVSGLFETEGGLTGGVRDDGHGEPLPLDLVDCEADPIDGNGAFVDQASQDFRGRLKDDLSFRTYSIEQCSPKNGQQAEKDGDSILLISSRSAASLRK